MNGPLVSIIVSCYNGEKYIADTINSLLKQTYANIEIVIVNDGSTDNSEKVIHEFTDTRIKYYKQQNRGQCAALNLGFSKSTGKYIKFYDADDILEPNVIQGQVDSLNGMEEDCMSFIEWRRFYDNAIPDCIDKQNPHTIHKDCLPVEYITWKQQTPMVQCGLWLIPRSLLYKTGLWDERLNLINDTEFFTRVLQYVRYLKFSDSGCTFYRTNIGESSLSKDFSKKGIKSALLSIDLSAKWMLNIENSDRIKKIIVNSYIMILGWAYPKQITFVKIIERRLKQFPKEFIVYPKSGKIYNVVMKLFGWKTANRLTKLYHQIT